LAPRVARGTSASRVARGHAPQEDASAGGAGPAAALAVELAVGADQRKDHDVFAFSIEKRSQIARNVHAPIAREASLERVQTESRIRGISDEESKALLELRLLHRGKLLVLLLELGQVAQCHDEPSGF